MAITAKFIADFSSFDNAVKKAEVELRSFETSAGKVEKSLQRMTDSFSGRKLISDATLMAEAVERIGGVSKLTEQELARVGATASEAANKLRAMGQDVPPGIQNIVDKTQHLNKTGFDLIGTFGKVAATFGVAFSVQAVTRFVGSVVDAASAIQDMADTLDVSTDAAQGFTFAARQTGAEMGDVERAIFTMNKALAGGNESTTAALQAAGLELSNIRHLGVEDAFREIAGAVGGITDPMLQAKVGAELFGKSFLELAPAIKAGFVGIADEAPKMSAASIKALDDVGDTWDRLKTKVMAASAEIIAAIINPVNTQEEQLARLNAMEEQVRGIGIPKSPFAAGGGLSAPDAAAAQVAFDKLNGTLKTQADRAKKVAEAAEKADKAQKDWNESVTKASEKAGLTIFNLNRLRQSVLPDVISQSQRFREEIEGWIPPLESKAIQGFPDKIVRINTEASKTPAFFEAASASTKSFGTHLKELFENVPKKMGEMQDGLAGMLTGFFGGGGTMHSIMSTGLNLIFGPASGLLVSLALQGIEAMAGVIWKGLQKLGGMFKDFFSWAWDGIKGLFSGIGDFLGIGGGPPPPPPPGEVMNPNDPGTGIPGGPPGSPGDDVPNLPNFSQGTGGRYLDFGRGTQAMLHGKEKITPWGSGEGGGGVTVNVYGSVMSERDLADTISQHLKSTTRREAA